MRTDKVIPKVQARFRAASFHSRKRTLSTWRSSLGLLQCCPGTELRRGRMMIPERPSAGFELLVDAGVDRRKLEVADGHAGKGTSAAAGMCSGLEPCVQLISPQDSNLTYQRPLTITEEWGKMKDFQMRDRGREAG